MRTIEFNNGALMVSCEFEEDSSMQVIREHEDGSGSGSGGTRSETVRARHLGPVANLYCDVYPYTPNAVVELLPLLLRQYFCQGHGVRSVVCTEQLGVGAMAL